MTSSNNKPGVWGETTPEMIAVANSMPAEHQEKKQKLKTKSKKSFGLLSVITTLIVFVIASTIFTGIYLGIVGLEGIDNLTSDPGYLILSTLVMYLSWVSGAWVSSRLKSFKRVLYRFKYRFKKFDALMGLGYAGIFFLFAIGFSWFLSDVLKIDTAAAENTSIFTQFDGILLILFAYGMVSIIGPAVEEFFFRGYIMQAAVNTFSRFLNPRKFTTAIQIIALIVTSAIFGFFHIQPDAGDAWWITVAVTGALGLFMGIIGLVHKRLGPAVFAHMFYNAATITLAIVGAKG